MALVAPEHQVLDSDLLSLVQLGITTEKNSMQKCIIQFLTSLFLFLSHRKYYFLLINRVLKTPEIFRYPLNIYSKTNFYQF